MSAAASANGSTDEPMAFTADDFLRGTAASWIAFNILFTVVLTTAATVTFNPLWGPMGASVFALLVWAVPIALVVSGVVTLLLCGAAWALGRLLRRQASVVVHVGAYALLGAAIGMIVVSGYQLITTCALDLGSWLALITIACSVAALPLGWAWAVVRARGHARRPPRSPRPDSDEAVEDAL